MTIRDCTSNPELNGKDAQVLQHCPFTDEITIQREDLKEFYESNGVAVADSSLDGILKKSHAEIVHHYISSAGRAPRHTGTGELVDMYEITVEGHGILKLARRCLSGGRNNGALTSLNLADNKLDAKGAQHVAKAIKVNVSALRFD